MVTPSWGEIWWGEQPDDDPRPFLILTRAAAIPVLSKLLVAPVTRSVRSIPTEVPLGTEDGLLVSCAASMDNVTVLRKSHLVRRMGALAPTRHRAVCEALAAAIDC